jgi:hypothetical protein
LGEPREDQLFIALPGNDLRELGAPSQRLEAIRDVMRMVSHPEPSTDHDSDAVERPSVGLESRFECATTEVSQEFVPLGVAEAGGSTRSRTVLQALQPRGVVPELFGPGADRSTTDPEASSDLGLGELACEQEPAAFSAAFFQLSLSQDTGLPHEDPA